MPSAQSVLSDPFMIRYGLKDFFHTYYTCIPRDEKKSSFECVEGKLDAMYSNQFMYQEPTWKVYKIPNLLPKQYHESYLNRQNPDTMSRILFDPPKNVGSK